MDQAASRLRVASADVRSHHGFGRWSSRLGEANVVTFGSMLLIAAIWLAVRPYPGVIHDSRFYTVQALSALLPGRFATDLYFEYGSQDQFTIFTAIYRPVMAAFGIGKAAMLLTILGHLLWIGALFSLARSLFPERRTALLAAAMGVALPSGVIFFYAEPFLTPRLYAEACTLWALGAMLRQRPWHALAALALSMTIHPLMTLPGVAILLLHEGASRRLWWGIGGGGVLGAAALAGTGVEPFVRITASFDTQWFAIVRVRDNFCFMLDWAFLDWMKTANLFIVAATTLLVVDRRERKLLMAAAAVAIGGLALNFVGSDLLHNVLVVDAQQYRATWPLVVVTNLLFTALVMRLPWRSMSYITALMLGTALVQQALAILLPTAFTTGTAMFVAGGLAHVWERRHGTTLPLLGRVVCATLLAVATGASVSFVYRYFLNVVDDPALLRLTLGWLTLALPALSLLVLKLGIPGRVWRPSGALVLCAAVVLVTAAAARWDRRTGWTTFIETTDRPPQSLTAMLPPDQPIYWEGDVRVPWFVLKRPSYFSCAQGTGSLFFRGTAIEFERRSKSFEPLRTFDFKQESTCPLPPGRWDSPPPTRQAISAVCAAQPALGALVLLRPAADAPGKVWVAPASFQQYNQVDSQMESFSTDHFYIYDCNELR